MDLISREQALGFLNDLFGEMQTVTFNDVLQSFEKLPSVFEGMTNEEVMKAVFGKSYADIDSYIYGSKDVEVKQWWRSPYKGVSE